MTTVRAARVSIVVGVLVLAAKLVAWRITGSVALFSDALESIVNVLAASIAMTALWVAAKPADRSHPWGHSKAEYFSAVAEGLLVVAASVTIIGEAVRRLLHPAEAVSLALGGAVALAATAGNLALGLWLHRQGRKLCSPALVADGTHVLADVFTTVGVLVGIFIARATGWWVLDPLVALAVAVQVVYAGWRIVRGSVGALMDETVPAAELERITSAVKSAMGPALEFHDLRARRAGPKLFIELHLVVQGQTTVERSHEQCDAIERAVRSAIAGAEVVIHVEPETERRPGSVDART